MTFLLSTFLQPRRFSEVWQADQEWPGTVDQQQTIRDAFYLEHGSDRWKLMKRLDKSANEIWKRSYLTVGFPPDDMWPPDYIAVAGISGINFRASSHPTALGRQAEHELFHVADKHLLGWADRLRFMTLAGIDTESNTWNRNVQETFADAGRDWWTGRGWFELGEILLPT